MSRRILALDLETAPAPEYQDYDGAALDHNRNQITQIALAEGDTAWVANGLAEVPLDCGFVTHGGKFDFKTALAKPGHSLTLEHYQHDTMLMLLALPHKIPEDWLEDYEAARIRENARLGAKVHRQARGYSLKTAAPYFLGVEPFWESADHSNAEYAKLDAKYTYLLWEELTRLLREAGTYDFYFNHLMPWSRMLTRAELTGASIDFKLLESATIEHKAIAATLEEQLREIWSEPMAAIRGDKLAQIAAERDAMMATALAKIVPSKKKDPAKAEAENQEKRDRIVSRYQAGKVAALAKVPPFNLASPVQLKELFLRQGWDITNFEEEESTGKEVLENLLRDGAVGIRQFIDWRKSYKLSTAFFPSYRTYAFNGVIHPTHKLTGTRTGRLSCSDPNTQQIPKSNMSIFKAPEGQMLGYRDASAIEPRVMAYLTECPNLCRIFIEGSDFHSHNVRTMLGIQEDDATIKADYKAERDLIKEVGLSLLYGAGWRRIEAASAKRGMRLTAAQCKRMFKLIQDEYQAVWVYKEALESRIEAGELITNLLGRPLNFDPSRLHLQSLNTDVQSGANDIVLESARIFSDNNPTANVSLFIHDAIIFSSPESTVQKHFDDLGSILMSWDLSTKWGKIPLLSEGYIARNLK